VEKSLRNGVHHANAVVWGPVYRTHPRLERDAGGGEAPLEPPVVVAVAVAVAVAAAERQRPPAHERGRELLPEPRRVRGGHLRSGAARAVAVTVAVRASYHLGHARVGLRRRREERVVSGDPRRVFFESFLSSEPSEPASDRGRRPFSEGRSIRANVGVEFKGVSWS